MELYYWELVAPARRLRINGAAIYACIVRTDGSWITDMNYDGPHMHLIAVGSSVTVNGYGRFRVKVTLEGKSQGVIP